MGDLRDASLAVLCSTVVELLVTTTRFRSITSNLKDKLYLNGQASKWRRFLPLSSCRILWSPQSSSRNSGTLTKKKTYQFALHSSNSPRPQGSSFAFHRKS